MKFISLGMVAMPLLIAVLINGGPIASARAGDTNEFIIAANDGYGLDDCLGEGGECGRVVADAWCEAHGRGAAVTFGPRSVVRGGATKISTADEPYVIRCSN